MRFSEVQTTQQQSWASTQGEARAFIGCGLAGCGRGREKGSQRKVSSPGLQAPFNCLCSEAGKDQSWQFCFDKNLKVHKRRNASIKLPKFRLGFGSKAKKIVRTPYNPASHYIDRFRWNAIQMVSQKHTRVRSFRA